MRYLLVLSSLLSLLCVLLMVSPSQAQTVGVEKSIYGVQAGLVGIWGYNESRLSNSIALRSDVGFDGGFWAGTIYDKPGFLLAPTVSVGPKWYYNFRRRVKKSKRIDRNSGNFFAIRAGFHPDWFVISNYKDQAVVSDISIVPFWGLRRSIGNHLNFETAIGYGYWYVFRKGEGYKEDIDYTGIDLYLKIGYSF